MNKRHARCGKTGLWIAMALACGCWSATLFRARADDQPPKAPPPLERKAEHPLPKHFDNLNLTDEQKKKVIAIMDECDEKIENHQDEIRRLRGKPLVTSIIIAHANAIKKLRVRRQAEVEKLLNDEQRAKLKELRATEEQRKKP